MKKIVVAVALAVASIGIAQAQDWIRPEVGIGYQKSNDMGDGTWIQQGSPNNHEKTNGVAFLAGFTGRVWTSGAWSVDYHFDYVYYGRISAGVDGVPDPQYDIKHHRIVNYQGERFSPFNGQGHVQGVPLTLDVGYTYDGWRVSAEGGAWVYWQTWHESLYDLNDKWDDMSHITKPQVGFVVGARVENGPFSLSYRYYKVKDQWNSSPGLVTGTQMLMFQYKF